MDLAAPSQVEKVVSYLKKKEDDVGKGNNRVLSSVRSLLYSS